MEISFDPELEKVAAHFHTIDPEAVRIGQVLRGTLDQLYDGQRTGRYRLDQLHKTEKTHCGTLVEINLHREFGFRDGLVLDYEIEGIEVDCKFSQTLGGWMIPPEAHGQICLVVWANDADSLWSAGLVRTTVDRLNIGGNRDKKSTLNADGRAAITWLFQRRPLLPNILLQLPRSVVDGVMSLPSGAQRLNELFRVALGMRVGRGVVATVAQQHDYMRRVRKSGGSRTALRPEGIIILGQYSSHVKIARALQVAEPASGESVAVRVTPTHTMGPGVAEIDGRLWRVASASDPVVLAPELPRR